MIEAHAQLADELDRVGLRALATTVLHERHEFISMKVAAMQRLERANDNQPGKK